MASPKLLLFFYAHFTFLICNNPVTNCSKNEVLLPENDLQTPAPVFGEGHAEDLDFGR
jgi:hypothetical protein